eukprot:6323209-Pyramimonas_sp.AAC.1
MAREALGLLAKRPERVDGEAALRLLPGETPLAQALPFLLGKLRGNSEARRNTTVVKSLRRYENLQVGLRAD